MILRNCKLIWTKGVGGYIRGIKGGENYRHFNADGSYNGHGGANMRIPMALDLKGEDETTGEKFTIDARKYLVAAIGRNRMTDTIFERLNKSLPNEIEIDTENKISQSSLDIIAKNYKDNK